MNKKISIFFRWALAIPAGILSSLIAMTIIHIIIVIFYYFILVPNDNSLITIKGKHPFVALISKETLERILSPAINPAAFTVGFMFSCKSKSWKLAAIISSIIFVFASVYIISIQTGNNKTFIPTDSLPMALFKLFLLLLSCLYIPLYLYLPKKEKSKPLN
jgi:hypothetical protein